MLIPRTKFLIILFSSLIIKVLSVNIGFFWDSVLLGSRVGHFFFENGFSSWHLPVEMDSGHPPLFGYTLALWWKVFGKTLFSSHLFMLPFVFGVIWQLHNTTKFFFKNTGDSILALILILADPTLSSQIVLVNPDLPQLFFFLLALNGLLYGRNLTMVLGLAFMGLTSFRGMMLLGGIVAVDLATHLIVTKRNFKAFFAVPRILTYLAGFAPAIIYLAWRYIEIGWIVTSPIDPQEGSHYHIAQPGTILRNIVVIAHRFVDFGRVFLFLFVAVIVWRNLKKKEGFNQYFTIALIFLLSTSVIFVTSIFIYNPLGHRYFIPSYIALGLLTYKMVLTTIWPRVWFVLLTFALLSGNLWVYPERIAQGWDSSLANLRYWPARQEAIKFMEENQIRFDQTGTFFPNIASNKMVMLDGKAGLFLPFSGNEKYVFYSNVYNLTDQEYELLKNNYRPKKTFSSGKVRIVLKERAGIIQE